MCMEFGVHRSTSSALSCGCIDHVDQGSEFENSIDNYFLSECMYVHCNLKCHALVTSNMANHSFAVCSRAYPCSCRPYVHELNLVMLPRCACGRETREWWVRQINGGFIEHCCDIMKLLESVPDVELAGFALSREAYNNIEQDWRTENDAAEMYGQANLGLVGVRILNHMNNFMGFPRKLGLLLSGNAAKVDATIAEFHLCWHCMRRYARVCPYGLAAIRRYPQRGMDLSHVLYSDATTRPIVTWH